MDRWNSDANDRELNYFKLYIVMPVGMAFKTDTEDLR
jgi:hypothetical protein